MCGFIACKKNKIGTNHYIKKRGEDLTVEQTVNGIRFIHNLLHITGEMNQQPFIDGDIICVYNGEIYNQPFVKSDGECLIPLYKEYGVYFPRLLEGEFAIALYDFGRGVAVFSTDTFRTKPLWINDDGVASYKSGLFRPSTPIPPNTTIIRNLVTGHEDRYPITEFDFGRQEKDSFDDWIYAFETAVALRATQPVFIGLSSGYDSGAIHCALMKLGRKHKTYSIMGNENKEILLKRTNPMPFTEEDYLYAYKYILDNAEDYEYNYYGMGGSLKKDPASVGMSHIFKTAKQAGYRIYLSGQGADEIYSDYALWPMQSDLKGHYPKDLKPWTNFFGGTQQAYLGKEEHVAGAYSIEGRYPFLDIDVVQEFLWLTQDLKNSAYKAPIREYLKRNNYPYMENDKRGFQAQIGLTCN